MLHSDQIQYLQQHFRITNKPPDQTFSFQHVPKLMNPKTCQAYLMQIAEKFNTNSLVVTASQFAKRYSFLLVIPTLYTMSVYNKGLRINPENCYIQSLDENHTWLPRLALVDWGVTRPPDDRGLWREQLLKQLFAENITKMWTVLYKCTGIKTAILWENTAIYIHWLYTQVLQQAEINEQIEDDYRFLLHQANAAIFGESFQPLQKFASKDGVRKTCCLYYLTNQEKDICKGCPRSQIRKVRSMVLT